MADTLTSLLESIGTLIDKLELIGFGDETTEVTHNGVIRSAVAKQIKDNYDQIQAMVDGQIPYETLALATAAGAPPLDANGFHKLVRVVGDPVTENNGIYYWDGGLIKSPYDPVEQSNAHSTALFSSLKTALNGYGANFRELGASAVMSGTVAQEGTFVFSDAVVDDCTVFGVSYYNPGAAVDIKLKAWAKSGDVLTESRSVTLSVPPGKSNIDVRYLFFGP